MVASPEIKRVVDIIDQRIHSLQTIKKMLIAEFFGEQPSLPFSTPSNGSKEPQKTRKVTLKEFLKVNGPTTRGEIEKQTGMPRGTLAFLLNDKETFERLPDGKWKVRAGM